MIRFYSAHRHVSSLSLAMIVAGATVTSSAAGQEAKRYRTYVVFGQDDRTPVTSTTTPPWSSIGMVIAHWGSSGGYQVRTGTGTLISEHIVLTAGHVVLDTGIGPAENIFFMPGLSGNEAPFGAYRAVETITTSEWAATQNDEHDLAMLLLDASAGQDAGAMGIAGQPPSFFDGRSLEMSGYPADLTWDVLYTSTGPADGLDGNLIRHYIDGAQGQSGGPMWFTDPGTGRSLLVGIYLGDVEILQNGLAIETYGYGIPMNATFCSWVSQYVTQHDPQAPISCADAKDAPPPFRLAGCGTGAASAAAVATLLLGLLHLSRQRL